MRGLHFDQNLLATFGRKLTVILAMAGLMAVNLGALEAKAADTVVNCSGGGSFTVSTSGSEIIARGTVDDVNTCAGTAVIPNGVTKVASFKNNPNLLRVEIPASVTSWEWFLFHNNTNLTAVVFAPNSSLPTIPYGAFTSTGLTTFEVPASVTMIENWAFERTYNLTSLTFAPQSQLKWIGAGAFSSANLTSVSVPDTVTNIETFAFRRNSSLTSVSFGPNSQLTTIGEEAFIDTALASIALGSQVQFFRLSDVPSNTSISIASNNPHMAIRNGVLFDRAETKLISYPTSSTASSYVVPSSVREIGESAFANSQITSINIPASVSTIGNFAFFALRGLAAVTFSPNSTLTVIGRNAFSHMGLSSIEIPASVQEIRYQAFWENPLTTVTFESGSKIRLIAASFDHRGLALTSPTPGLTLPTPSRSGYLFTGWSESEYGSAVADSLASVQNGRNIYALWEASVPSVSTGLAPGSQEAGIPRGMTTAELPATANLPKVNLAFTATSTPASATVALITNPAAASDTPFLVTSTTKFVDIQVNGITGPVSVCLDGAPTDEIFHFYGGAWVALPQRSYVNGQVCGVTSNFSPFAAAALASSSPSQSAPAPSTPAQSPQAAALPMPTFSIINRMKVSTAGQSLTLQGSNLSDVSSIKVGGTKVKILKHTSGEIVIDLPASSEGYPTVEVQHAGGVMTLYGMIQVAKPYELTRTLKITKFVGSRPTLAGISALYKAYRVDKTANILNCVMTVASDASAEQISNAEYLAKETCQRVVRVSKHIKTANIQIQKDGAAGSKPVLTITFDRTLSAVRG